MILVDDGIATGATMHVAALDARSRRAGRKVVVAVPTAPRRRPDAEFAAIADEFVCPYTPPPFHGGGKVVPDFSQVDDDEVRALLLGALTPA